MEKAVDAGRSGATVVLLLLGGLIGFVGLVALFPIGIFLGMPFIVAAMFTGGGR